MECRVRDAFSDGPSQDATAHLAGLLGALSLEHEPMTARGCQEAVTETAIPSGAAGTFMNIDSKEPKSGQCASSVPIGMDEELSYMCEYCGNIISRARREHHDQLWCSAAARVTLNLPND